MGLTQRQIDLFLFLQANPEVVRPKKIADKLGISDSNLSPLLKEFSDRGIIDISHDPADKRKKRVQLVENARKLRANAVDERFPRKMLGRTEVLEHLVVKLSALTLSVVDDLDEERFGAFTRNLSEQEKQLIDDLDDQIEQLKKQYGDQ